LKSPTIQASLAQPGDLVGACISLIKLDLTFAAMHQFWVQTPDIPLGQNDGESGGCLNRVPRGGSCPQYQGLS
jgi:hypothetical protein